MRRLATLGKALSDETRLDMLALLLSGEELCVCDFEHVLGIHQSKASRHLRYLLNAGLLEDRREAVWVYYRLAHDLSPDVRSLLDTLTPLMNQARCQELNAQLAHWQESKKPSERGCR